MLACGLLTLVVGGHSDYNAAKIFAESSRPRDESQPKHGLGNTKTSNAAKTVYVVDLGQPRSSVLFTVQTHFTIVPAVVGGVNPLETIKIFSPRLFFTNFL